MNIAEEFRDIPGYEGLYQVSNFGNVKSLSRELLNQGKNPFISKEKILKAGTDREGYKKVVLSNTDGKKTFKSHVLVAIAFLGHIPCGNKIVVDHKNDNPSDNRLENLQLVTNRENLSRRGGSSKYAGVSFVKSRNKWNAHIQINGKIKNLGYYSTEYEAHYAYQSVLLTLKNN
jgi:hypothetical protein